MRRQFGIALFIVLASFFLGACDRPLDLAANLNASTKDIVDSAQLSEQLLTNADSKVADALEASFRVDSYTEDVTTPTPIPTPGPDSIIVFEGFVEEINDELWIIDGRVVMVTDKTLFIGNIQLGDRVEVTASLGRDGVLVALKIQYLWTSAPEFIGRVFEIGDTKWLIGDYRVLIINQNGLKTEIIGDIQVGDLVRVKGILEAEGVVAALEIKLIERPVREVEFTGRVREMGRLLWLIGDHRVLVTPFTQIEGEITVGDLVKVRGVRLFWGIIVAREIQLLEKGPDFPEVEFIGRVQEMGERFWLVGDHRVQVTEHTEIVGDIQIGDLVKILGFRRDGVIVARVITLIERPEIEMDFIGRVKEMGERFWLIGDHRVLVTEQTEIFGDIQVRDLVKVHGFRRDGVIVARVIKLLERPDPIEVEFIGRVKEMGERFWLIGDWRVRITERTRIDSGIGVGDLVKVRGTIAFDSVMVASEIKLVAVIDRVGDGENRADVSNDGD